MALDPSWVTRKLRQAVSDTVPKLHQQARKTSLVANEAATILKGPASHHRPRTSRTFTPETRAKLRAQPHRRKGTPAYEAWRAAVTAGGAKRWSRERERVAA